MTEPAADPQPRRRPIRWTRVVALVVVVVAAAGVAVGVPQILKPRQNGVACQRFEAAYNDYVGAIEDVRENRSGAQERLDTASTRLPIRVGSAVSAARGDVKKDMLKVRAAAAAHAATPADAQALVQIFLTSSGVRTSCDADGSAIDLRRLTP